MPSATVTITFVLPDTGHTDDSWPFTWIVTGLFGVLVRFGEAMCTPKGPVPLGAG